MSNTYVPRYRHYNWWKRRDIIIDRQFIGTTEWRSSRKKRPEIYESETNRYNEDDTVKREVLVLAFVPTIYFTNHTAILFS